MKNQTSFEDFMEKSKDTIKALNNGDSSFLLKKEKDKILNEEELRKDIINSNYIDQFNSFLKNLNDYYVGRMLSFDYKSTKIITNDNFILKQNGISKGSFLIASLKDFNNLGGIEHFILLFVNNFTKMEDDKDTQLLLINHHKELSLKAGLKSTELTKEELEKINREEDVSSSNIGNLSYLGLDCKILGMFYRTNDKEFNFTSQVNLILSAKNYFIAKPNKEIRNIIINNKAIESAFKNDNFKCYEIGKYSETESDVFTNINENPKVLLDINTIRGKRTAMFGKTRLGKSNTVKIILSSIIQDNIKKSNSEVKDKMGVVVFDVNGEYSNINNQDKTSIYEKYKDTNIIKRFTLDKRKNGNLMLNFYINPSETMGALSYLLKKDGGSTSIYIESFLNTDLKSMTSIENKFNKENMKVELNKIDLFKIQLFWALLNKAGYNYRTFNSGKNHDENKFFDYISRIIANPFKLSKQIYQDLEKLESDDYCDISKLKYENGDSLEAQFAKMTGLIDVFVDVYINNKNAMTGDNKKKYILYEPLLEMFDTTSKAGYKILRKLIDFHSEKSDNKIDMLIKSICDDAMIAIIDLSTTASNEVNKFYTSRMVTHIFNKEINYFITNESKNLPQISFVFEEAHNLFPTEKDSKSVYYKLAKEGAKYGIGMIYSTQSPSNIYSELLTQTENFFVGHLSSPKEVSALTSLSYNFEHLSYDLMNVKKVGHMRIITDNHRYPIPVQINIFE